jgi:hypothetical protein
MELREMLDLVRWVGGRRRILVVRRLIGFFLRELFVAVMSYRPSGNRAGNKSSASCPSPHSHRNSLRSLG